MPTSGCLVETIGEHVLPVKVTAEDASSGYLDIGDVEVKCSIGPRVDANMGAYKITDASGREQYIADLEGQYVLLHAWATWCAPCLETLPNLKAVSEKYGASKLVIVGLNVDEDQASARALVDSLAMDWTQNYLGEDSALMRQLAVSSIPAYYLIGPDGKLIGSTNQWGKIEELVESTLE